MTSTTLTLKEFSDKLDQTAINSTTPEGNTYAQGAILIFTENGAIAYFHVPGEDTPHCNHFDSLDDQELVDAREAYRALLHSEGEQQYGKIDVTFRNESGDYEGKAIVPTNFEYYEADSLIIDGTGYGCNSDYNILG